MACHQLGAQAMQRPVDFPEGIRFDAATGSLFVSRKHYFCSDHDVLKGGLLQHVPAAFFKGQFPARGPEPGRSPSRSRSSSETEAEAEAAAAAGRAISIAE